MFTKTQSLRVMLNANVRGSLLTFLFIKGALICSSSALVVRVANTEMAVSSTLSLPRSRRPSIVIDLAKTLDKTASDIMDSKRIAVPAAAQPASRAPQDAHSGPRNEARSTFASGSLPACPLIIYCGTLRTGRPIHC